MTSPVRFGSALSFELRPAPRIIASALERMADKFDDMREPLTQAVTAVMIPSFAQNFASGGRPSWPGLSPSTIRRHGDHRILQLSGALEGAATSLGIWTITNQEASIQRWPASVWYGKIHQAGSSGQGGNVTSFRGAAGMARRRSSGAGRGSNIPQRQFILFQEGDVVQIVALFERYMEDVADIWTRGA